MTYELVIAGLTIGAILYALLIRRRAAVRLVRQEDASALSTSSQIAVARINEASRRRAEPARATYATPSPDLLQERRSGRDRRVSTRRWGRGRRSGGDRRRGDEARQPY